MPKLTLAFVALLLGGCGHRAIIDFTDASAVRLSDGRVSVSTHALCTAMLGHSECGVLCVTATWIDPRGTTLDSATKCESKSLPANQHASFTLTSSVPIPASAKSTILLDATTSYARPWQSHPKSLASP